MSRTSPSEHGIDVESIRQLLTLKFKDLDDYIDIAIGEAVTAAMLSKKGTGQNFERSIYAIAKNRLIDEYRRRNKLTYLSQTSPAVEGKELQQESHEISVTDKVSIQQLLETLTEKQAEVMRLHYLEGMSIPEIAVQLNITSNTVKDRLKNSLASLRKIRK